MKRIALLLMFATQVAGAQDSSFTSLRFRGGLFRMPVVGHISDDWRPKTGLQVEVASNVGAGELAIGIAHVLFVPTTGKVSFTETLISLGWTSPEARMQGVSLSAGARLTDVRMDFEDPSVVVGLRTEEEVLLALLGRAHVELGHGFRAFGEASFGALMLSTRSPTMTVALGIGRVVAMPGWVRDVLR
jgi:hypothetical protein